MPHVKQETIYSNNCLTTTMLKAYKFRIYPTKAQKATMDRTLDLCRWTYNKTLETRKAAWENEGKSLSKYETNNLLPAWKHDKPELNEVFSQVLQNVHERVDLALKAFFRRAKAGEKPGYPRFRGKGWYDSFTYPQKGFKLEAGKLRLSKIGDIKMCSRCGILVDKTLSDRVHNCPNCGLSMDRDRNAAINILRLWLQSVGV